MTPIKRKLLYIFRGDLLRLRITWNRGCSITLSTGYHVDRTRWNGERCSRNSFHGSDRTPAAVINAAIASLEDRVNLAFFPFESNDTIPGPEQLRSAISTEKHYDRYSLSELIVQYLSQQGILSQWSYNTTRSVRQALDNLVETFGSNADLGVLPKDADVLLLSHGHKTLRAMLPYIDILSRTKAQNMERLNILAFLVQNKTTKNGSEKRFRIFHNSLILRA